MKKYFLIAAAVFIASGYSAVAQEDKKLDKTGKQNKTDVQKGQKNKDKDKLGEYDEIVIKRKDVDADKKITIEIRDDEVLVDGKSIDEFVDEDVNVRMRKANKYKLHGPVSPFRFEEGDWMMENNDGVGEERAFLGVMTEGSSNGARVEQVTENSAAAKAGIKAGDVITKLDGKEIFDHEQLSKGISEKKPGDEVTITYKRDGREHKATAKLEKRVMPAIINRNFNRDRVMPPMTFDFDGADNFQPLFEMRNRPRLGIKAQDTEDGAGVKVLEVEEGSAAFKAGIKENDIITTFEGKEVKSAGELVRAAREASDKSTLKVQLKRDGKPQTIEVKVPKKLKTANL